MFLKINNICGSWHEIKWHVSKISSLWYSGNTNTFLKTNENKCHSMVYNVISQPRYSVSEDERREYLSLFPTIVKNLTEPYKKIPEVAEKYVKVLHYNVPTQKQASGLAVVGAYKSFESAENLTPKNIRLANILGWCDDLFLCSLKVTDDIMDGSQLRNGMPCWYRHEEVGMQAINDALLLENGPYLLLKNYFSQHHCYFPSVEWFHKATVNTAFGQSLDTMNRLNGKPNLGAFTMDRHTLLCKYKGTYPLYFVPIKLAMYFAGKYDINLHKEVASILLHLGEYLKTQNDILDCYGDPAITGKMGSDIHESKCTWLVVVALERTTPAQRQLLRDHYGRPEPESELKIRVLYEELGILDAFLAYEEDSYNAICRQIQKLSKNVPKEYFLNFVNASYGRQD